MTRRKFSDHIAAHGLYIDPPLGRAGLRKEFAKGFMKILVDAQTHEILGAAILGTGGDEAIHSVLDVMYTRAPYTVIQLAAHIHPTVSELIPTMFGESQPHSDGAAASHWRTQK